MSIVSLGSVSKSYGATVVLAGVSLRIGRKDKVGLIGRNGSGKTTLLRIIAGDLEPDSGRVNRAARISIAYLAQQPALDPDCSIYEQALHAFDDLKEMETTLRELERQMSAERSPAKMKSLVNRHGRLQEEFEHRGGYAFERRTREVLSGIGFPESRWAQPVGKLSGGERTRLATAMLLLQDADLLLLDEPTNFLDMQATEWLETFLADYAKAFVVVSHDRFLLDKVAGRIIEVEAGRVECYPGGFSHAEEIKAERLLTQRRRYEKQQKFIARQEDFIRRNIAGQRSKEARGRRKKLARLERIERPLEDGRSASFEFSPAVRGGNDVLELDHVSMRYGTNKLFEGLDLRVTRGECIGIVGPNGSGKTTLLDIIAGTTNPLEGRARLGHKIRVGYYRQHQQQLKEDRTVLETIWEVRPAADREEIRTFLGRFMFSQGEVEKSVASLSGGERSRLALAKIILSGANFLLLDEPTSHLDIPARQVLEQAICAFPGAVMVVSHDRYLLDVVADKILALGGGNWRLYHGNYSFYRSMLEKEMRQPEPKAPAATAKPRRRPGRRAESRLKRMTLQQLEDEIISREEHLERLSAELAAPETYNYPDKVRRLRDERDVILSELSELNEEWERRAASPQPPE